MRKKMRSVQTARLASSANLSRVDEKFRAGPNELEQERFLKVLQPRNAVQSKQMADMVKTMRQDAQRDGDKALDLALGMWEGQLATGMMDDDMKFQFVRRFYFWLLGRGIDADHKKTFWGRGNAAVINREVANYIEQFARRRLDFALQLSLLANRVPSTLLGYWLYFKYVVGGEIKRVEKDGVSWWDITDDNYLADFELFLQYFSSSKTTGYAPLIAGAQHGDPPFDASRPYPSTWEEMRLHQLDDKGAPAKIVKRTERKAAPAPTSHVTPTDTEEEDEVAPELEAEAVGAATPAAIAEARWAQMLQKQTSMAQHARNVDELRKQWDKTPGAQRGTVDERWKDFQAFVDRHQAAAKDLDARWSRLRTKAPHPTETVTEDEWVASFADADLKNDDIDERLARLRNPPTGGTPPSAPPKTTKQEEEEAEARAAERLKLRKEVEHIKQQIAEANIALADLDSLPLPTTKAEPSLEERLKAAGRNRGELYTFEAMKYLDGRNKERMDIITHHIDQALEALTGKLAAAFDNQSGRWQGLSAALTEVRNIALAGTQNTAALSGITARLGNLESALAGKQGHEAYKAQHEAQQTSAVFDALTKEVGALVAKMREYRMTDRESMRAADREDVEQMKVRTEEHKLRTKLGEDLKAAEVELAGLREKAAYLAKTVGHRDLEIASLLGAKTKMQQDYQVQIAKAAEAAEAYERKDELKSLRMQQQQTEHQAAVEQLVHEYEAKEDVKSLRLQERTKRMTELEQEHRAAVQQLANLREVAQALHREQAARTADQEEFARVKAWYEAALRDTQAKAAKHERQFLAFEKYAMDPLSHPGSAAVKRTRPDAPDAVEHALSKYNKLMHKLLEHAEIGNLQAEMQDALNAEPDQGKQLDLIYKAWNYLLERTQPVGERPRNRLGQFTKREKPEEKNNRKPK